MSCTEQDDEEGCDDNCEAGWRNDILLQILDKVVESFVRRGKAYEVFVFLFAFFR